MKMYEMKVLCLLPREQAKKQDMHLYIVSALFSFVKEAGIIW